MAPSPVMSQALSTGHASTFRVQSMKCVQGCMGYVKVVRVAHRRVMFAYRRAEAV